MLNAEPVVAVADVVVVLAGIDIDNVPLGITAKLVDRTLGITLVQRILAVARMHRDGSKQCRARTGQRRQRRRRVDPFSGPGCTRGGGERRGSCSGQCLP